MSRWLWPAAVLTAAAIFFAIRFAADSVPAFAPSDRPLVSLDAELLAGNAPVPLGDEVPTVILLWMPG